MATTNAYKCYPSAAAGASRASSGSTAWSNSSYTELVPVNTITSEFNIAGVCLNYTNGAAVDVTHEVELDIATGSGGSEVVIMTIPFTMRIDSAVGHQPGVWIPITNPRTIPANTRLSVRVRQSLATTSVTYAGIKIFYY